jgi:hypothetical protein
VTNGVILRSAATLSRWIYLSYTATRTATRTTPLAHEQPAWLGGPKNLKIALKDGDVSM